MKKTILVLIYVHLHRVTIKHKLTLIKGRHFIIFNNHCLINLTYYLSYTEFVRIFTKLPTNSKDGHRIKLIIVFDKSRDPKNHKTITTSNNLILVLKLTIILGFDIV